MDFIYDIKVKFISIIFIILELITNVFNLRRSCNSKARLDGKVVVITGANTGIGRETAHQLLLRGAKVIIGCRDMNKAENVVQHIKLKEPNADITAMKLDLSSLASVRQFAKLLSQNLTKIDILINNAGIMNCPEWITEDGFEMQFGTNHLGHFLLTLSLLHLLKKSSKARIITVSSVAHITGKIHFNNINLRNNAYTPMKAYRQSKLANILFTRELAKRLKNVNNINVYCLHPGIIRTELWRYRSHSSSPIKKILANLFLIDVKTGAQTTLYCALEEKLENETGFYYSNCRRIDDKWMVGRAVDEESAQMLWELSSDLVKLEDNLRLN